MKVLWLRRLRSSRQTDFHSSSLTYHSRVNSTKLNYSLLDFKSKICNFPLQIVKKKSLVFFIFLYLNYMGLYLGRFLSFGKIQTKVGVEVSIMSIGLKNVAIFGCAINLFHKGNPPQGFLELTLELPKPSHMSQDCGEILLFGSLGIITERFPLDPGFLELVLSLFHKVTGKYGCDEYSGPLNSSSLQWERFWGTQGTCFALKKPPHPHGFWLKERFIW